MKLAPPKIQLTYKKNNQSNGNEDPFQDDMAKLPAKNVKITYWSTTKYKTVETKWRKALVDLVSCQNANSTDDTDKTLMIWDISYFIDC